MLALALRQAFPGIRIGWDSSFECVLSDGAISHWSRPEPRPDEAAILAVYDALKDAKNNALLSIRTEARQRIEAAYPDWRQRSAALGLYPAEYVSAMQAAIASVIAASNTGEDAVDAAADVAAVEAVTVTWPVI